MFEKREYGFLLKTMTEKELKSELETRNPEKSEELFERVKNGETLCFNVTTFSRGE